MKQKPVVMILENSIDVTGALKSIARSANDLKNYYDFKFILPSGSKAKSWLEGKTLGSIQELPMKEISKKISSLLLYIPYLLLNTFRLRKKIKREGISIIHVNDVYNLLPAILCLFGSKVPYVCHIRFLPNRFPSWLFNFWLQLHLRYASKVVAVSQSVLKMLPSHPKLTLIYGEVPTEEQYPELTEPDLQKTTFTFLYLSNFMEGKGHEYAIEAFAEVHQDLSNWKLRFVGGDMGLKKNVAYKENLMEKAKVLGIWEKTEWLGFTEDVEREYKQADVVLNFSESESFSITCVEALYFGRPVIATDCGGPSEIIDNNESGILVRNRDTMEMSTAMLLLAKDNQLRKKFSFNGRQLVRSKFSIEKSSLKLNDLYKEVLGL